MSFTTRRGGRAHRKGRPDRAGAPRRRVQRPHRRVNEVFSGGADYVGDTGQYLRALAQVNNAFATRADNVCRVVCGLPVYYKGGEKL